MLIWLVWLAFRKNERWTWAGREDFHSATCVVFLFVLFCFDDLHLYKIYEIIYKIFQMTKVEKGVD